MHGRLTGALLAAAAMLGLGLVGPAAAQGGADDPPFISFGIGYYDVVQADDEAVDFRLEYRHDQKLWIFKPWIGVEGTSDGAIYGLGGILIDLFFGDRFVVTPSFGAGAYHDGDGRDLGGVLEFRSQIEIAYRFDDRSRLGIAFGHISNANLFSDDNPGVEVLNVYYSMPLGSFFR